MNIDRQEVSEALGIYLTIYSPHARKTDIAASYTTY